VSVWCIFALQDAAAIALRGSLWVPIENAAFGIAKILVLLALAASSPTFGVIASWTVPMALVLVPMNLLIFKVLIPAHVARGGFHERVTTRQLGSFAAVEYLTSLASTAGSTLVPLIVVARVGGDSGGYFYVVWAIGASIETALNSIGTSLVVEGARNPDRLDAIARALSRRVFVLAVPCLAIGITLSHFLLSVFGSEYARHSTTLLRLMLVGALPRSVVVLWMSMNRVTRRIGRVLLAQTLLSGSMIVLISLSVSHNGHTDAVGVAYLVCQAVVALVVLPDFVRGLRAAPLSATASGAN
jgi:hypothetical protein